MPLNYYKTSTFSLPWSSLINWSRELTCCLLAAYLKNFSACFLELGKSLPPVSPFFSVPLHRTRSLEVIIVTLYTKCKARDQQRKNNSLWKSFPQLLIHNFLRSLISTCKSCPQFSSPFNPSPLYR